MATKTITPNSITPLIDTEAARLEQIINSMSGLPGMARAYTAIAQYRAGGPGHLLMRAENLLTDAIPHTTTRRDSENLADALIRLGRIAAFNQIAFAVA